MRNAQSIATVILIVTAAVLSSLLVAGYVYTGQPARASVTHSKDGDYIMTVGTYGNDADLVYVIDIAHQKLNVYFVNVNTSAITLQDSVDLSRVFGAAAP